MIFGKIMKYGNAELNAQAKEMLAVKPQLRNLFWETTLRCNANCKHCGSRAGGNINSHEDLKTDEIKKVFKEIADRYDANSILLSITGGEPLIREDLFEVMQYAYDLGFHHWGMTSNGLLINDDIIENMKKTGMSTISISIDGIEKTHDNLRGIPGVYKKTIENIKKLKEANFLKSLQVTTVITKKSINELEKLYEEMKELNIDSWRVVNIEPIGRAKDNADLYLDKDDYINLLNFIKNKRKKSKFEVTYGCSHYLGMNYEMDVRDQFFSCQSGYQIASILHNGDIFVCPNVERHEELIQGNVRKDSFCDVWENEFKVFRDRTNYKYDKCANCEDWKYCQGDSLHTWDFVNKKPRLCINKMIN